MTHSSTLASDANYAPS